MKKKLITIILILLFFTLHLSNTNRVNSQNRLDTIFLTQVQAQTGTPGSEVRIDLSNYMRLSDGQKVSEVFDKPNDMVNLIVRVVFVGVGLVLFVMTVMAGLSMIAAGTTESKNKAKGTLTSALIGFIIIFSAYWIMQIIQILTGTDLGF